MGATCLRRSTAYLAKLVDSHKFGDEIEDYVKFAAPQAEARGDNRLRAVVLKVDRFGNLITNVTPEDAPAVFSGKVAVQDCGGQQRDYGDSHGLCRGRAR